MSRFASLTAGLLARKGEAEPTATPFADQLLTRVGSPAADIRALTPMTSTHAVSKPSPPRPVEVHSSFQGAFGRRALPETELGELRSERTLPLPAPPPPLSLHEEEHSDAVCTPSVGQVSEDPAKTFHVNLRLKRARFVKLKLSAALLRRPVQEVVSEALDQWFDKLPPDVLGDCACLRSNGD